ncbi:splicing factor 3B subunit 10 SF3b10 [Nitzschia inconspicua]|uniref:Splicing factor 3B subunit 10 SF3b10 n=1 Tax=Nitzschia inconspicua TaxID=303405 RepID=A0A9K3KYW3_9STRA|nr:splicing factor 3B subunit 10 SF3b10 [Nitzschia inconspicua]
MLCNNKIEFHDYRNPKAYVETRSITLCPNLTNPYYQRGNTTATLHHSQNDLSENQGKYSFRTQITCSNMSNPGGAPISAEQLKARYVGTGHADMSKYEWITNQHRDTYASHIAHYDQLSYYAVAQNVSIGRARLQFLDRMIQPCGPPPKTKDIDKMVEN